MKLLKKKQVCEMTSYSRAHIDRLSNDPEYRHMGFPKPIRLGQSRVAYVEEEIISWISDRVAQRKHSK